MDEKQFDALWQEWEAMAMDGTKKFMPFSKFMYLKGRAYQSAADREAVDTLIKKAKLIKTSAWSEVDPAYMAGLSKALAALAAAANRGER